MLRRSLQGALLLCVLLTSASVTSASLTHSRQSVQSIAKAYGFVIGQETSIVRIEKAFPNLKAQANLARLTFDSSFPNIRSKLERELSLALREKGLSELKAKIQRDIASTLDKQTVTNEGAQSFLETIKARAKGQEIDADVLSYLLAIKYSESPVDEFNDKFRQRYATDGTGKSQGLQIRMQLPLSWKGAEGERPHIVQKWISEGGTGMSSIMLLVQDTQGVTLTRKDIDQMVRDGELRDALPVGGKFIAGAAFSQEKGAGYWIESTLVNERAGLKMASHSLMYMLFFRAKAISVQCAIANDIEMAPKLAAAMAKLKPLCQQVMNSLVLPQAY